MAVDLTPTPIIGSILRVARPLMLVPDEWKRELAANFWVSDFMGRAETMKYIERDHAALKAFLLDLGPAK